MKALPLALAVSFALLTACTPKTPTTEPTAQTPATTAPTTQPVEPHAAMAPAATAEATPAAPKLQADMRALWRGHIDDTRAYAMAVQADNTADADAAAAEVVSNAKDISAAVASFYGDAAGAGMLKLLSGHWGAVKAMTDAAKKGDEAGVQKGMDDGIANAAEIATFLASANPNLPEATVDGLMVTHVQHHRAQVTELMAGDTAAEARTWAAMQTHMDVISDALAAAIAKQFPDKAS